MKKLKIIILPAFILSLCALWGIAGYTSTVYGSQKTDGKEMSISLNEMTTKKLNEGTGHLPEGAVNQKVYIDPETGEFINPPKQKNSDSKNSLSSSTTSNTSQQGLMESVSPVPGGGMKIDLQGRFRIPLIVEQDNNNKMKIKHSAGE